MTYHIAKGVFDILPIDPDPDGSWRQSYLWQYFESLATEMASLYGYREIRTPLFEHTELFTRSVGTETDIITKEMYTFKDKGDRSLSLRPEGTASVMRAFIEKRLDQIAPIHKLFYILPMFRYERQQAGRYRQHHQFGVEAFGCGSPLQDVEVIDLFFTFLQRLGLKGLTLQLNTIGLKEEREKYKTALREFLSSKLQDLSKESQERFQTNILRILDSKDLNDIKILEKAPSILEFLGDSSKSHFECVCKHLNEISIPYTINSTLVRGLDYYNHTVFEVTANELGAQNSLGGGGRYDGLMKTMGGPDLPGIGFGAGLERIIQTCIAQKVALPEAPSPLLYIIPLGDAALTKCFNMVTGLRREGLPVEMELGGKKLKNAMRDAAAIGARYVLVLGDEELASGKGNLKEMATRNEEVCPLEELSKRLKHG